MGNKSYFEEQLMGKKKKKGNKSLKKFSLTNMQLSSEVKLSQDKCNFSQPLDKQRYNGKAFLCGLATPVFLSKHPLVAVRDEMDA